MSQRRSICTMTALIHFQEHILLDDAALYVKNQKVAESFQSLRRRYEKLHGKDSTASQDLVLEVVADKVACQFDEFALENLRRKIPSRNTNGSLKTTGSGVMDLFNRLQQFAAGPVAGTPSWQPQIYVQQPVVPQPAPQLALPPPTQPEGPRHMGTPQIAPPLPVASEQLALPASAAAEQPSAKLSMVEAAEKFRILVKGPAKAEVESNNKKPKKTTSDASDDGVEPAKEEKEVTRKQKKEVARKISNNSSKTKSHQKNVKKTSKLESKKPTKTVGKKVSKATASKAGSKTKPSAMQKNRLRSMAKSADECARAF